MTLWMAQKSSGQDAHLDEGAHEAHDLVLDSLDVGLHDTEV